MKTCPYCGTLNEPAVDHCTVCGGPLPGEPEGGEQAPSAQSGMHWFPAFLIMAGIRWIGSIIIGAVFAGSSSLTAGFFGDLLILYIGLYVWLQLTGRRYGRSGTWAFFTYLWYVLGPITLAGSYAFYTAASYSSSGGGGIFSVIGILAAILGAVYVSSYRKKTR